MKPGIAGDEASPSERIATMTAEAHRQFDITGTPPGEYGVVTEPGTIRLERVLPGPLERVWSFLTESERRGRWLAAEIGSTTANRGPSGRRSCRGKETTRAESLPTRREAPDGFTSFSTCVRIPAPRFAESAGGFVDAGSNADAAATPPFRPDAAA